MEIDKAMSLARKQLEKNNLFDWQIEMSKRFINVFGQCRYQEKTIVLSEQLVKLNDEDRVLNTILHEIAHALVGRGNGHNWKWKMKCTEIGAIPKRCYSSETTVCVPRKIRQNVAQSTCPICKQTFLIKYWPKRGKICRRCSDLGVWPTNKVLVWKHYNEAMTGIKSYQQL